jgi:predicted RNA binding protein with dsRBD fold (UPF0201 family)
VVRKNGKNNERKVKEAIQNIFQQASVESVPQQHGESLVAKVEGKECLSNLKNLVKKERILKGMTILLNVGRGSLPSG